MSAIVETVPSPQFAADAPKFKAIGLCMIVKNEAHVIERCLESTRALVDYVLVVDTGSSDGTQEIVRAYLRAHNLAGAVVEERWRDFAHNRTFALKLLRQRKDIDYALIMDADDVLACDPAFDPATFKAGLTADIYGVELRLRDIVYTRPQICSNRIEFLYRGVLHEFIDTPDRALSWGGGKVNFATARGFHIRAGVEGSRSLDPKKYRKDADILRRALGAESNPFLRSRYTFYLAQTLRDAGEKRGALKAYAQRADMAFWNEERFISLCSAAEIKAELGDPMSDVIAMFLQAFEICPHRLESLHDAVRHCRNRSRFQQGYVLAKGALALGLECPAEGLYVRPWIYEYGMLDEFAVAAYWAGRHQECLDACESLLTAGRIPESARGRIEANTAAARDKLAR